MLSPQTVPMTRCPVCDATGKTGTTLGFGGTVCALCHGTCFLRAEPNPCPCCNANGGFPSLFGLRWNTCRLCHGLKFLIDRPLPCPKCRATGQIKGLGGVFSTPCDLCDRQCYIRRHHGRCIKCNFSSLLFKLFRKCINCGGIGYSPEPQYLCPRCNSTGRFKGNNCMLCTGNGVIHHEVGPCANCNGAGEVKRTLSLLLGNQLCPTCLGQGYFTIAGGYTPPRTQKKTKGKRGRDSDDDDGGEDLDPGRVGEREMVGGSEPRRRVKPRSTPADRNRRQTISAGDVPGPQQQPLPMEPPSDPRLDEEREGGGSSASDGRVFRLGVAGPAKATDAKRRRSGV